MTAFAELYRRSRVRAVVALVALLYVVAVAAGVAVVRTRPPLVVEASVLLALAVEIGLLASRRR